MIRKNARKVAAGTLCVAVAAATVLAIRSLDSGPEKEASVSATKVNAKFKCTPQRADQRWTIDAYSCTEPPPSPLAEKAETVNPVTGEQGPTKPAVKAPAKATTKPAVKAPAKPATKPKPKPSSKPSTAAGKLNTSTAMWRKAYHSVTLTLPAAAKGGTATIRVDGLTDSPEKLDGWFEIDFRPVGYQYGDGQTEWDGADVHRVITSERGTTKWDAKNHVWTASVKLPALAAGWQVTSCSDSTDWVGCGSLFTQFDFIGNATTFKGYGTR